MRTSVSVVVGVRIVVGVEGFVMEVLTPVDAAVMGVFGGAGVEGIRGVGGVEEAGVSEGEVVGEVQ